MATNALKSKTVQRKTAKPVLKTVTFAWEGKDRQGARIKGEMLGQNPALIRAQLRRQGVNAIRVRKKPVSLFAAGKKIKPLHIAAFTRQLATMVKAGVPLLQSLDLIIEGQENPRMRKLVDALKQDVSGGNSLGFALRKHPLYFDDLYCNLVESGEQSGALETLLERIASYKEKTESLKGKIKKAMYYPAAVIFIAVLVSAILLIKVVPQFQEVFSSFGAQLPVFTQMVIGLSEMLQEYWLIILLCFAGGIYGFKELLKRSENMRNGMDKLVLNIPVFGNIIYKSATARFARTLSTTFAAGVPLTDALDSVAGATGNVVFRNATWKVKNDVSTGSQLNFSMRKTAVFPPLAVQMTAIGEESGALDSMLDKVASIYEEEVDNLVDSLTSLMEPLIMVVLGVLVGGLVIAMYLPIIQMGSAL